MAALMALLPQLLLLGLGRGVVLCSATDGHVQMEILASGCCDDALFASHDAHGPVADTGAARCGACTDFRVVPDDRMPRVETEAPALVAIPLPAPAVVAARGRAPVSASYHRRIASHLLSLRSVSLRC